MKTQVFRMDATHVDRSLVQRAGELLRQGGLVAFPTETVYGVGVSADQPEAVARLREVKRRSPEKAFTVHIASRDDAALFVPSLDGMAARLARKGWPGPMTLILAVPDPMAAPIMQGRHGPAADAMYYNQSVGLRCPDDAVAREILRIAESPIVAASANRAGDPPALSGREAEAALNGEVDLLIDMGETKYAKASTVIRVDGDRYEILREGVYDRGIVERLATVRILFVCTGNTCRSPMAAGLASKMISERLGCDPRDLEDRRILIESAGIAGGVGGAAVPAINVMNKRGIDISPHSSRALSADLAQQADYIFVMTRAHNEAIMRLAPSTADRISLLLGGDDLIDPIGGGEEEYERCATSIESGLLARLKEVVL